MRPVTCLALCALALAGCGGDDSGDAREGPRLKLVYERIDSTLAEAPQGVPEAGQPGDAPNTDGGVTPAAMEPFLDDVLADVERYWARTLAEGGATAPAVKHQWLDPGERLETACRSAGGGMYVADDDAAAYCPADDTIYFSSRFAAEVWQGLRDQRLPGASLGHGRAIGDFGVAYVVAHEYAHNVQWEKGFGIREGNEFLPTRQFELNADCLAGLWANSVYLEGRIAPGDVQEAIGTVLAVGSFDVKSVDHHGTPKERREAWQTGYGNGDPEDCGTYLEPTA